MTKQAQPPSTGQQIATAGLAAAGTAIAPGIGTAVGAALGNALGGMFGGANREPRSLGQASPEVQAWFADVGGSQFKDWLTANKPEAYGWTVEQILPLFYAFLMNSGRSIGWWTRNGNLKDPRGYRQGLTEQAYRAMGVDYEATAARFTSTQPNHDGKYIMLPGGGTPQAPAVAVNELQNTVDKARSGQPLTPQEQRELDALNKAAKGGLDLSPMVILVLLALVAFIIFRS